MKQSPSRIKDLRLDRDWSQAELAARAHLSKRTVERLEQGAAPTARALVNVALAFGCDLYAVMDDPWLAFTRNGVRAPPDPDVLLRPEGDVPPRPRRERAPRRSSEPA